MFKWLRHIFFKSHDLTGSGFLAGPGLYIGINKPTEPRVYVKCEFCNTLTKSIHTTLNCKDKAETQAYVQKLRINILALRLYYLEKTVSSGKVVELKRRKSA